MEEWREEKGLKVVRRFPACRSLSPQYFYPSNRGQEGIITDTVLI